VGTIKTEITTFAEEAVQSVLAVFEMMHGGSISFPVSLLAAEMNKGETAT